MENIIILLVVVLILALAIGYIVKQKKGGAKCIGCPHSKECGSKTCNCNSENTK